MRRRIDQNNFKSSGYLWPLLFVILLVIGLIGGVTVYHHYEMAQLNRYPFRGVAVDQQDGYVDFFSLAKTGQKFVYIRATQGSIYTDNDFDNNYQRAEGSGLSLGVYHILSFNSRPQTQFRNFRNQVANNVGSLPIAVKVGHNHDLSRDQLKLLRIFVNDVKRFYRKPIIIWASQPVANQLKLNRDWINQSFNRRSCLAILNSKETLNLNGQDNSVTQMVFNGDQHDWRDFSNVNRLN